MLRLRTLGGLALASDERPLGGAATQRRPLGLLAVLAVAGEGGVSRERLQTLLWPESDAERARKVLAQTVYAIRRDLGSPDVVLGTTELRLNPSLVAVDAVEFKRAVQADELERAVVLYAGPFLDGVHLADAPEFERWAEAERDRLSREALGALERLARAAEVRRDWEVAAGWWRRLAALDPFSGRVSSRLMAALAAAGDSAGALRHARVHEALLRDEFGAPPDPAVAALAARLRTPGRPVTPVDAADPIVEAPTTPPREESPPARGRLVVDDDADRSPTPILPSATAATIDEAATKPRGRHGWRWVVVAAVVLATLAIAAARLTHLIAAGPLDRTLVAVVPFDAADPALRLWREGMVDVLSRNLDGAGPIRSTSPTVVVRQWSGRADRPTVRDFARGLDAGTAVYGDLLRAGTDSVRVSVTVLDVGTGRPLLEVRRIDAIARMDRLTDSLTMDILRALGRAIPVQAAGAAPIGSATSLEALRAFLRGEQAFRQAAWDSAIVQYEQAVSLDSGLALAWRRLGLVSSWRRLLQDSLTSAYALRAGAANHGLGPRDSLLIAADSLTAAANTTTDASLAWSFTRRLFRTLDVAARQYPSDPEVWFAVGEARYHFGFGPVVGVPERATLDAFDRAIALDSAFAPAYLHAVELGLNLGGAPLGLRYARAYLALQPTEAAHGGVRIVARLLGPGGSASPGSERLLDTVPTSALVSARTILRRWPDSAEVAVRLSRILAKGRPSEYALFADTGFMRRRLAEELAFRGHLAEAATVLGPREVPLFAELAYLGAVAPSTAQAVFARWTRSDAPVAHLALAWWSSHRDTASLAAFMARANARLALDDASPGVRTRLAYDTVSAGAHLALARGDTVGALGRFVALPDTACPDCYLDRLTRARVLAAAGRDREALHTLDEPLVAFLTPIEVVFALERARIAARTGDQRAAESAYRFVRAAWRHGDPSIQPVVAEAARAGASPPPT